MLIMSFINKITHHNEGKNKLKKFAGFAWTDEGKKLCEGFCMEKSDKTHAHSLFEVSLQQLTSESILEANFMAKWWYKELLSI